MTRRRAVCGTVASFRQLRSHTPSPSIASALVLAPPVSSVVTVLARGQSRSLDCTRGSKLHRGSAPLAARVLAPSAGPSASLQVLEDPNRPRQDGPFLRAVPWRLRAPWPGAAAAAADAVGRRRGVHPRSQTDRRRQRAGGGGLLQVRGRAAGAFFVVVLISHMCVKGPGSLCQWSLTSVLACSTGTL